MTKGRAVPGEVLNLLNEADKARGFPIGTMASVMQQEVGGNVDQYLADPTKYHYEAGKDGRRIAPQSGKESTAFGPFGLLESTAAKPGYGVKPLADKSLEEQVRFAADYLQARAKAGGGLQAGLAGYGEGPQYATQVMDRMGGRAALPAAPAAGAPVVVAQAPMATETAPQAAPAAPVVVAEAGPAPQAPVPVGPDPWQEFLKTVAPAQGRSGQRVAVAPEDLNFGPGVPAPSFAGARAAPRSLVPNFQAFSSWKGRG